jgi:hypothetical protein
VIPPSSLSPGEEQIIVLQRGPTDDPNNTEAACFPGEKADNATDQGWDAVILTGRHLGRRLRGVSDGRADRRGLHVAHGDARAVRSDA